ncbi:MAG: type III polyketide synthase [Acidobacteria bacterium]|nr:MAG: type III polyketide synthase [Acidobacteriota bacterium]
MNNAGAEPLRPRITAVGTANPQPTYTQDEVLELFRCDDPKVRRFFESGHIHKRHLVLPEQGPDGIVPDENGTELLEKHTRISLEIGSEAIRKCLANSPYRADQLDYIAAASSTGFLCPGLTAYFIEGNGMRPNTHRTDIVGMGCNAGMNSLLTTASFAAANPGRPAMVVACEVCSAAYVFDMTVRTGVVNSLFGDGAAAALVIADEDLSATDGPQVMDFESCIVHAARDEMRFDFEEGKFSFFLGWEVPYLIGENVRTPVFDLLDRWGLKKRDISHWIVHSGGKKVIDAIKYNIGITEYDVRHTYSILRDYGNISSASFLFSLQELMKEGVTEEGDWGVVIAMGPGVSIETGLLRW